MLTAHQSRTLNYLVGYQAQHGYAPSYDEIKAHLGIRSKSGVTRVIVELEDRKFIRHVAGRRRSIEILRVPDDVAGQYASVIAAARRLLDSLISENPATGIAIVKADALGDLDVALGELDAVNQERAA
jgi:SOS-response transcriptional repressor LexA